MHRELAAILERSRAATDTATTPVAPAASSALPAGVDWAEVGGRGLRLAVAAPRGHAKSTLVTLAFILWSICEKTEEFIVIASVIAASGDQWLVTSAWDKATGGSRTLRRTQQVIQRWKNSGGWSLVDSRDRDTKAWSLAALTRAREWVGGRNIRRVLGASSRRSGIHEN